MVSLHVLHQVGTIGKHLGAQGTPAPALLLAVQALVLHVSHTVSEGLKEGSSALLCCRRVCRRSAAEEENTVEQSGHLKEDSSALLCWRRVCRRSAAEEANTVEHRGQLAGWYRARTGMEGLELEACGDEDSLLMSGKEVLFIDFFFFFLSGVFRSMLKS